jgi:hypothetical protein
MVVGQHGVLLLPHQPCAQSPSQPRTSPPINSNPAAVSRPGALLHQQPCRTTHRATPLDIFNFFDTYDIIAESLQLGVDALGRPSGEAWLTLASSEEALRAVRERNRHYLGNRYLELSLT